jgi:hypothetical protein
VGWVWFIIAIIVVVFGFALIWNLTVTSLYLWKVWLPPVLVIIPFLFLPPIVTWFVCRIYKEHDSADWTNRSETIRKAWRKSPSGWLIFPLLGFAVLAWAIIQPWEGLWAGALDMKFLFQRDWGWSEKSVHDMFLRRTFGVFFFSALPTFLMTMGIHGLLQFAILRRAKYANQHISGTDEHTASLVGVDEQIDSAYGRLGSEKKSPYAERYRTWVRLSVREILRDQQSAKRVCNQYYLKAVSDIKGLTDCQTHFEVAESAYRNGLARLRRESSIALLESLEDSARVLKSPGFIGLIESKDWKRANTLLDVVHDELLRIDQLADSWFQEEPVSDTLIMDGPMTEDRARQILNLTKSYTQENLEKRRKTLSQIYHPDPVDTEPELKKIATTKMAEINEACDYLLNELRDREN